MKNKFKFYLEELRAPFFTASIVPVLLGTAIAWSRSGEIHWWYFILTLIGGVLVHAGTNIANDYYDHKSGDDEANVEYVRPFSGGSRLIQRGLLKPKEVLTESLLLFAIGSIIGLYLAYTRGFFILLLGIVGVFSGYFYTAPPIRLANSGIGEFIVGLNFGTIMTLGANFVQTQKILLEPVIASIPVALLIAGVLYINEFPDYTADKSVGKNHLVVRLGKKRASIGYAIIIGLTYLSIIIPIATGKIPIYCLIALLSLPLAVKAVKVVMKHYHDNQKLIPAMQGTIMLHLLTGLLLSIAYIIDGIID